MSFAAAIEHLHGLGLELAPPSGADAAGLGDAGARRKFELDHMRILARALGDPQLQFPAVLIAGTNGKGSTAATLASILAAAGYRTGLYTSPHLVRVTERIRVAEGVSSPGAPRLASETWDLTPQRFAEIAEDDFARLYFRVDDAARALVAGRDLPHHPSFFETLTALAFLHFAERKVEIAILEVGLGGRLDATNIVEPILSVITDIALDHQEYLGNTIAEIAREKAGILRPNGTLITLPQHPEANQSIGEAAMALNVRGINAADYLPGRTFANPANHNPVGFPGAPGSTALSSTLGSALPPNDYTLTLNSEPLHVRSPLAGEHQQRNIALAIAAAIELRNQSSYNIGHSNIKNGYNITNSAIEAGIETTQWPGRLEWLPPNLLLDVAHNPAGAWTLRAAIARLPESQPRTLIFSCLRDKDLREMAQILFPLFDATGGRPRDHIVLAPIANPRAASLDELLEAARKLDTPAHAAHSPAEALALARSLTPPDGIILATGSVYLVGALREAALAR
jgi:dihydrofolate synthase/folylpolyglutamate synthase